MALLNDHTDLFLILYAVSKTKDMGKPHLPEGRDLRVLDLATLEREARHGIMVRPERSSVSPFCTELTTLTQDDVESGVGLAEACAHLRKKYRSRSRSWIPPSIPRRRP